MSTTRLPTAEVRQLFEEALDLEPRARAERLGRARPEQAEEVERLLAAAQAAPEFLEHPAQASENLKAASGHLDAVSEPFDLASEPFDVASELAGTRVGPWILEARLSVGGTGEVYRARRADGETDWRVALKLLRLRGDDLELRRRFEAERRSLAVLAHPYIVPLVDAGWLADGRPYLATRLVEGQPLDSYCAGLELRARLALFLRVCSAVQHAHECLIAHCDLKPANILVTAEGLPQLLDFGIARLFAAGGSSPERALTPGYASPEQLAGGPLAAASDVYSLGAVFQELASGARGRRGDLGAVVAKALATDPAARYPSVAELARDLERFLDQRPVQARPATHAHRARLFLQRQPALAAAALVGVAALGLGIQSLRRDLESSRAEASLGWRAHAQAALAARMLEDLARGAGPGLERALDEASARLASEPELLPETEGRLRIALGALYLDAGRKEDARANLLRARELTQSTRGFGRQDLERLERLLESASR